MRFVSNDPIGLAGGSTNLYLAYGNGPANALDPWGALPQDHHWFPQHGQGASRRGQDMVNAICCGEGITFDIDDFTTTLENSPGIVENHRRS
jgi:hypothetical protein